MKIGKLIFFISMISFLSSAYGQPSGKGTYIDVSNDFFIEYPDQWELEEGEEGIVTLYSPYEANDNGDDISDFEEKIQITPSQWDEGTLDEFVDANFNPIEWEESFSEIKITKKGKETINGKDSRWVIFTYSIDEIPMTAILYFIKNSNKIVSILAVSKTDDFEMIYKKIYLEVIRSTRSYIDSKTPNLKK